MNVTSLDESDYEKGFTHDADSPLQQETAIPAPIRKRNNSIIPQQLLNDTGGGGRERAALATVFGVLEYSESKIFWERQSGGNDTLQHELIYGYNNNANGASTLTNDSTITTLSSFFSPLELSSNPASSSPTPSPGPSTFNLLPDIPTVSQFNDIFMDKDYGTDFIRPPLVDRSMSSTTIQSAMAGPMYTLDGFDEETNDQQVSTPLLFIGYPPAVFDLLKPDNDDRIIIWGPDPKAVSASMATTTKQASPSPSRSTTSTTTTDSSTLPSPPLMRGFSSNTTTSMAALPRPDQQGRSRLLSGKLTDGIRKSLRSNSLIHRSSTDNLKSILLLKRTFGSSKLKQQQDSISLSESTTSTSNNVTKVIEAASVEKLVEKLTITLDYEFMTDFFLTYRSFISPTQLCKLIILRFRWALENDEEDRRVVRIRTFVVMRHWLLNYFVHDFIPIRDLRVVLTTFLNALPSHPLVRSSPRDQRIVKGLKRVVRRLKKVYYNGTNSHRVQVIAPPPPSSDQERVEEMVRANLAHGLIRRKTALVRGVDVGGKHNGNMAVQDARRAPMVVIGNVRNKPDFQSNELVSSDMSMASSRPTTSMDVSRPFADQVNVAKQSYLQRLEVERKMNALASSQDLHESTAASQASIASDDSLESAISPGTTEIASDEDYYDDEDTGTLNFDDDTGSSIQQPHWKSNHQQNKLEQERRRREEEEERKRAEFFTTPLGDDGKAGDQPSLSDLYVSDSRISIQRSLSSGSEVVTPTLSTNATKTPDQQQQQQQQTTTESGILEDQQVAVLAALGRAVDGPIRKAAIGDTSRIRRVPSNKWCQVSPDEDFVNYRRSLPQMPNKTLAQDLMQQLDDTLDETNSQQSAIGLSRRLSRKSIEKRKSEKNLRDLTAATSHVRKSVSTPNSPYHYSMLHNTDDIPGMPPLPTTSEPPLVASTSFLRHLPHDKNNTTDNNDDFEAIPYDKTASPASTNDASSSTPISPRRGLSKKFVNRVFSRSVSTPTMTKSETTPPPIPTTTTTSVSSAAPSTSKILIEDETPPPPPISLVSRIAQELRDSQNDFEIQCDCVRCTGSTTGPRACRRFSLALLTDDDKRHSLELRRRRGASIDKDSGMDTTSKKTPLAQNGPMYLGQLGTHSESDIGLQINEIEADDDDDDDSILSEFIDDKEQQQQQQHFNNSSLDRLTGVSTKGDGTSILRQALSMTSIDGIDPSIAPDLPSIPPWQMDDDDDVVLNPEPATHFNPPPPSNNNNSTSFILSYRSGKMAQQLCFIERDVLLGVDWEEMVHCRWTKMAETNEVATQSQHDSLEEDGQINYTRQIRQMQLARQDGYGGIEQVIERFNTVCQWVASEIVSVQKLDLRVKVVEKFIRLAQKCRMYSNFATLVQILLGLQSPSVSRLKKTWARVGTSEQRLLDQLSQFTSPMRNWKHIRDNMTMVADEYGMSPTEVQVEMPGTNFKRTRVKIPFGGCIPFLGIYLSDLVFNSEQPPYLEPNHAHHKIYKEQTQTHHLSPVLKQPLVNFRKYRITATVIKRVLTFQNLARRYAFDVDDELYERCLLLDPLDADTVRRLSYAIE
ncbi:hypothetical protein BC941DRAFT_501889 [Chlamydoabsidia padenii]|nr:hypothetical protein BC941DRAFT_501889 [Chlamydoabsidia padenii]